jgi:DNA-binding transcriptional LysR family regulator
MAARTLDQIGLRLRIRDLQIFLAVVEYGSMAKAAAHLGVTQPAVSEVVAGLESTFGARLFDRSPQGIETTLYGRVLLDRTLTVLDELKQGAKDIAFLADPTVGELRIGCPDSIVGGFLPVVIRKFTSAYPGIALHVDLLSTPGLNLPPLRARTVDLALTRLPRLDDPPDSDFNVEILFEDEVVVAASAQSRWARQRKINLTHLAEAQWILTAAAGTFSQDLITQAFSLSQLRSPKVILSSLSVHLRNHLLADSEYVAAMPWSIFQANERFFDLKMLPVKLPARRLPVALVTLRKRTLSPVAELFIGHLRKQARSMIRPS